MFTQAEGKVQRDSVNFCGFVNLNKMYLAREIIKKLKRKCKSHLPIIC